jgi:hypothetical protein
MTITSVNPYASDYSNPRAPIVAMRLEALGVELDKPRNTNAYNSPTLRECLYNCTTDSSLNALADLMHSRWR